MGERGETEIVHYGGKVYGTGVGREEVGRGGVGSPSGAGPAFILQKCDKDENSSDEMRYTFSEKAYLHGVMDGDAVDWKDVILTDVVLV